MFELKKFVGRIYFRSASLQLVNELKTISIALNSAPKDFLVHIPFLKEELNASILDTIVQLRNKGQSETADYLPKEIL